MTSLEDHLNNCLVFVCLQIKNKIIKMYWLRIVQIAAFVT